MHSEIKYNAQGNAVTFSGPDAVELFRVATLSSAIGLLSVGVCPTRGLTMTKALAMCKPYTGKSYKRSEFKAARDDLKTWIELMKSSIPSDR